MRAADYRITSVLLTIVFVLSGMVSGTLGWQSLSQQAQNESEDNLPHYANVELFKLEKLPDDTLTQTPVSGAAFYLYKEDGAQLGGRYVTDSEGKIPVQLESGNYYFEEAAPAPGYTFDTDKTGQRKIKYPFTVTENETETVVVTAYNIRLQGPLSVQKVVQNADASPLTEAQKQQAFPFTITFSDGGTYSYRIDGGAPQQLTSGGTLTLKHGQTAVFQDIPVGVTYVVAEQPVPGYTVSATGHRGTITASGSVAHFTNTFDPSLVGKLIISKEVAGDGADWNKEFAFTAVIGGKEVSFTLKHGESKTFPDLPVGTEYTVTETDYTADGYVANIKTYTGAITGAETLRLPFVNTYQPQGALGSLRITKEVVGENPDPNKLFTFEVEFSNGKGYPYSINGGKPISTTGPIITLQLKGGQTAKFEGIPEGVTYTVKETDPSGYWQDLSEAGGTIVGDTAYVIFRNRVPEKPEELAKIRVTKKLAGEYPETDKDKEFQFTLIVDGKEQKFTLKPGQTKEFEIPAGSQYEVQEADYYREGYALTLENGAGTARPDRAIEVTATNTFVGEVQARLEGEKTWKLGGHTAALPESITVRLKDGDRVVEEKTVTPDKNGVWHYTFTTPKYDADGKEIQYTVEELPVEGFFPSYDGLNITNTYIPPAELELPLIEKMVEGEHAPKAEFRFLLQGEDDAPMPEGSDGKNQIVSLTGSGKIELGKIVFSSPGTYTYTISELNGGEDGWEYDSVIYTLTITVTQEDGKLSAQTVLAKEGEPVEKLQFVNRYAPDQDAQISISGTKTWNHGNNSNPPKSIIVYAYGDGELAAQRLVTEKEGWKYTFELPKYAEDGHEIHYTIDEAPVEGYEKIIDGYNLINTYDPDLPIGPDPGDPDKPTDPDKPGKPDDPNKPPNPGDDGPQTGDNAVFWPWVIAMVLSLCGLIITVSLQRKERYRWKHLKR
jgi:pilin isopeptide linkage protein